jgi:hypothetical protein
MRKYKTRPRYFPKNATWPEGKSGLIMGLHHERKSTMSNTKIALTRTLLFAAALMILSCASPMRLTDNWRNSTYKGPAFKKIMVVALTRHDDLRQPIEDEFAKQLRSRGVEVATCHEYFPDPDKATREELIRVSQGMGIEAYLIGRVLGTGTDVVTSGPSDTTLDSMTYIPWFGPRQPMTRQQEAVTIESRLYDGKTMGIVWRSTVDAVNPTGSDDQISRFVSLVVKTLRDMKLIPSS